MLSGGDLECQVSARSQLLIYKPCGKGYGWMLGTSLLLLRQGDAAVGSYQVARQLLLSFVSLAALGYCSHFRAVAQL